MPNVTIVGITGICGSACRNEFKKLEVGGVEPKPICAINCKSPDVVVAMSGRGFLDQVFQTCSPRNFLDYDS